MLKNLKNKEPQKLQEMGLSENEIKQLELDYVKELQKRAELSNNVLKNMGYTDEQIKILKDFQGD